MIVFLDNRNFQKSLKYSSVASSISQLPVSKSREAKTGSLVGREQAQLCGQMPLRPFSSPEPVVSWSRGRETRGSTGRLQIKPSGSGDENALRLEWNLYISSRAEWGGGSGGEGSQGLFENVQTNEA